MLLHLLSLLLSSFNGKEYSRPRSSRGQPLSLEIEASSKQKKEKGKKTYSIRKNQKSMPFRLSVVGLPGLFIIISNMQVILDILNY
jgi:hypothetical protein